jgi:hypothetical protein
METATNDADKMLEALTLTGPAPDSDGWEIVESSVESETISSALLEMDGKLFRVTVEEIYPAFKTLEGSQ